MRGALTRRWRSRASAAAASVERLARRPDETRSDRCAVAQWRAWRLPTRSAATAADTVSTVSAPDCAALVVAIRAVRAGRADAAVRLTALDSLLTFGPVNDGAATYATIALARLYAGLGDRPHALAAIRRRPYMFGWPAFLGASLLDESRFDEALRDRTDAARNYAHLRALRSPNGMPALSAEE